MRPSLTTLVSGTIFKYFPRVIIGHSFLLFYTLSPAKTRSYIMLLMFVWEDHPSRGTRSIVDFEKKMEFGR
jgi:hypothetical protein